MAFTKAIHFVRIDIARTFVSGDVIASDNGIIGNYLPSLTIDGRDGDMGTATLTATLGPYDDYRANWTINATGALVIDDIQLVDVATGQVIASESGENPVAIEQVPAPCGLCPPTGLTQTVTGASVALAWQAPDGSIPLVSYVIEAGTASGSANLGSFDAHSTQPSMLVPSVPAGTYFVRVRAKSALALSGPSNEVVVTVR